MVKIAFGCIVFEGEYVLRECLESIYPYASQIMIAEGPVSYWQTQGRTTSLDLTNEILHSFPDPEHKISIIHGQFKEKDDQCKAYMQFLKPDTNYIWNLDSDEIFKSKDIETLMDLLEKEKYTSVGIKSCTFYGGFERHIGGFEEKKDQFLRIFKVYPGSTWLTHRPPTIVHPDNIQTLPAKHLDSDTLYNQHGIKMYHYSYVFPKQVSNKISYYKNALTKDKCIDDYFNKVYIPWVLGNYNKKMQIEQEFNGVHEYKPEFRSETFTKDFIEEHPRPILEHMEYLKPYLKEQLDKYI